MKKSVKLEVLWERPGEYVGIKAGVQVSPALEASIFDRSRWQPQGASDFERWFQTLHNEPVHVLVVHHIREEH